MGWDTYLRIGILSESWRKDAPPLGALLFEASQYQAILSSSADAEGEPTVETATFRCRARQAIARLHSLGYSWDTIVTAYADVRDGFAGFARGALIGTSLRAAEPLQDDQEKHEASATAALDAFNALKPEYDLSALAHYYAFRIEQPNVELSSTHELPGGTDSWIDNINLITPMLGWKSSEVFAAMRAATFLSWFRQASPQLGTIVFFMILLHAVDRETLVELDLTEHVQELLSAGYIEDIGSMYADEYLSESFGSLRSEATLMGRLYAALYHSETEVGRAYVFQQLTEMLERSSDPTVNAQERGTRLEDFIEALVAAENGLVLLEKRFKTEAEEIDLVLRNELQQPFWIALQSPTVLVECKNWSSPVGVSEARDFEGKILDRGPLCRVGVFIAANGVTEPFKDSLRRMQQRGMVIFVIVREDLVAMLKQRQSLSAWLASEGLRRVL